MKAVLEASCRISAPAMLAQVSCPTKVVVSVNWMLIGASRHFVFLVAPQAFA